MKLYLDTSSLIKLYYQEDGTEKLDHVFGEYIIEEIFLSEISITEFYSAIFKKVRTNDLSLQNASDILSSFATDQAKFTFIPINSGIISLSKELLEKYGALGLRALDALQLASVLSARNNIDLAISNDLLLNSFLKSEAIKITL